MHFFWNFAISNRGNRHVNGTRIFARARILRLRTFFMLAQTRTRRDGTIAIAQVRVNLGLGSGAHGIHLDYESLALDDQVNF